ncbi:glycosyltransferase family 2 protein [Flavobacterium poyangense]|uniref:glycosyltransferase family 2 protein n=1 Tax=Flavobacterium poyangense TaxID=2204302 RepID=UPI001420C1E5|nr:glycosyltransferase [Flavobacterium sp. JXAS1]
MNPLVSVIIPTYNRSKYLMNAIQSVSNQSYNNIEIVVVDDGSSNNYAEAICNQFPNCTYFFKKNGGLSSARNFGINKANGEFIAFLDDDDFWGNSKIEKQIKVFQENPKVDCVHSAAAVVNEKGQLTGDIIGANKDKVHKRSGYVFWNALGTWVVKSPTPLIRKSVFKSDMMFDENIKVGEDVDFYQRMFYRHKIFYIQEPLAFYREYLDEDRLSKKLEKYIGLEYNMLINFKQMGVINPFVLYRIKLRLAKRAILKWEQLYSNKKVKISFLYLIFNPTSCIIKFSRCE